MNDNAADFFSALSHPVRLRILLLLTDQGELCVCELTHALGVSQPMISRHLALLKESDVVAVRREGVWIYYRLHPKLPKWSRSVLQATLAGLKKQAAFVQDCKTLRAMPNRPKACCE